MRRSTLSIMCLVAMLCLGLVAPLAMAGDGPLANVTVSFGQWKTDPPLDRLSGNPAMGAGNNHELIPNVVTIKAGGAVNFIISGLHNPAVYDDGTQPDEISTASPLPGAAGGIINDANNRIYRGIDPNSQPPSRDRVEVVYFPNPGTYLVICGVLNHFVNDGMFGFVTVLPPKEKEE